MTLDQSKLVKVFFSYAHEDEKLMKRLEVQLGILKQQGQISTWHDRKINAGSEWVSEINSHLTTAHVILLLVSPDFMASDYCNGVEVIKAMERHEAGTAHVIPVILRPVYWENAPFSKLQVLPIDGKPVTMWRNIDEAFLNIAKGIHDAIKELSTILSPDPPQKIYEQLLNEGRIYSKHEHYKEALEVFEEAIRLNPTFVEAYNNKGNMLYKLERYEEALEVFEEAIRLNPTFTEAYKNKGNTLYALRQYEKALSAFEEAIRLNPTFAAGLNGRNETLHYLKLRSYTPNDFLITSNDRLPKGYLSIEISKNKSIAMRPEAFPSLQNFLDTLYINYLNIFFDRSPYPPYTYGKNWMLASKTSSVKHLLAPWSWLTKRDLLVNQTISDWSKLPPEIYGLNTDTHWQIIDKLPISAFGVATNSFDFAREIFSLSRSETNVKKMTALLNEFQGELASSAKIDYRKYKFLFILSYSKIKYNGRAMILE